MEQQSVQQTTEVQPCQEKKQYILYKKARRENKRTTKRDVSAEEVIFIFEKVLENWKTIKIFNTIIQNNPHSQITKKKAESISTGNCKLFETELPPERYAYYQMLREQVYEYNNKQCIKTSDKMLLSLE